MQNKPNKNKIKRMRSMPPLVNTHFKWVKSLRNNNPSRKGKNEKTNPISHTPSRPGSIPIAPRPTPNTQRLVEKTNPISTPSDPRIRQLYYLEHAKLLK